MEVRYDGRVVGVYYADILAENLVIVEVKAVKAFDDSHLAQCLNYPKATGLQVGLLLNFGQARVQVKRVVNNFGRH